MCYELKFCKRYVWYNIKFQIHFHYKFLSIQHTNLLSNFSRLKWKKNIFNHSYIFTYSPDSLKMGGEIFFSQKLTQLVLQFKSFGAQFMCLKKPGTQFILRGYFGTQLECSKSAEGW